MQSTGVIVIIVFLVATALTSTGVNCANGIRDELLPIPSETSQLRAEILQTLQQDTLPAGLEPREMLDELAQLRETAPGTYERAFHREMHKLGEEGTGACNSLTMLYIYEIVALSRQHSELPALANYINLLKTYGKSKFAECAATTEDQFKTRMSEMRQRAAFQNTENGLDSFFMAYSGSKRMLDDAALSEVAENVRLESDNFKLNRLLRVAERYRLRSGEVTQVKLLIEFLTDSCVGIQAPLKAVFGGYNIAEALGAQLPSELPTRFLKLNAYNRICMVLQTRGGEEGAIANIERQMKAVSSSSSSGTSGGSKWFKFGMSS